jgi:hypothetical protein
MSNLTQTMARAGGYVRQNGLSTGLEILINFVLPFLIYDFGKKELGDVHALMASSAPPIAWSIFEFVRSRRVDALSMLVLAGIALSLLAYAGGGSVKVLQLREKLVTATIGLVFLGSAAIGRPLIYQLARASILRKTPNEVGAFDALRDNAGFKRTMLVMTLVWGCGLLAEAGVATLLVFRLSIREYLIVSPMVGYGTMGALSLWTYLYARRRRRMGEAARQAAEAAALAEAQSSAQA